jgi:DNA mismatch endonuclease (patch repair protein)
MTSRTPATLLGVPYPQPTSAAVTAQMRGNRRVNTKPEIAIRSALHRLGYRFRKDYRIVDGDVRVAADIVFPKARVVVFIDGCFWHRCPEHGNSPRANGEYWRRKLDRNVARDRLVNEALEAIGWHVIRVWEHEGVETVVDRIQDALQAGSRPASPAGSPEHPARDSTKVDSP